MLGLILFKLLLPGLSFRTTEESLRNAFQNFGQLVEGNHVFPFVYICMYTHTSVIVIDLTSLWCFCS